MARKRAEVMSSRQRERERGRERKRDSVIDRKRERGG